MSTTLGEADAELARWRARLAAASRNVSELSELPEFARARVAASGSGRLAEQARGLVATMDELWQGVLLIGAALDQAEAARKAASRWRPDEAARHALEILQGPSITVDLADTPVLHRTLLGGPRRTVTVSPDTLLRTMDGAFDRAREILSRVTEATARAATLRTELGAAIARLPAPGDFPTRLAAAEVPDPLDRLEALEALAPVVAAAAAGLERARAGLDATRTSLAALEAEAARVLSVAAAARDAVAVDMPVVDAGAVPDLAAWLGRVGRTIAEGRVEAGLVGLQNWMIRRDAVAREIATLNDAATAALAARDDLAARLAALRAKHRARGSADPALRDLEAAAKTALARPPVDLAAARRDLGAYQAALARSGA